MIGGGASKFIFASMWFRDAKQSGGEYPYGRLRFLYECVHNPLDVLKNRWRNTSMSFGKVSGRTIV